MQKGPRRGFCKREVYLEMIESISEYTTQRGLKGVFVKEIYFLED